jgi:hypothetical protein
MSGRDHEIAKSKCRANGIDGIDGDDGGLCRTHPAASRTKNIRSARDSGHQR